MDKLLVKRATKPDCIVEIMYDRNTNKYCFVNLSSHHVCSCRFNTVEEAFNDLNNREDVVSYGQIQ